MSEFSYIDLHIRAEAHLARRISSLNVTEAYLVQPGVGDAAPRVVSVAPSLQIQDSKVYLKVPLVRYHRLSELLRNLPQQARRHMLLYLSSAVAELPTKQAYSLDPECIFVSMDAPRDSGVLFMPAGTVADIRRFDDSTDRTSHDSTSHLCRNLIFDPPDRDGPALTAFGLAALWFLELSSTPFCLNPDTEQATPHLYERFRETFPRMHLPLAEAFDHCLSVTAADEAVATVRALSNSLANYHLTFSGDAALFQELSHQEHERRRKTAETLKKRRLRRFRSAEFIRIHGSRTAAIAVLLVLAVGLLSSTVYRALQPPPTIGLTPLELVRAHYNAVNTLDPELLRATVARGVASRRLDEVTNLHVTSQARFSVEMRQPYASAEEWITLGRPNLEPGVYPYGMGALTLEERYRTNTSARIEARFIRVEFSYDDHDRDSGAQVIEEHVAETLSLERFGEVWRIVAIEARSLESLHESD